MPSSSHAQTIKQKLLDLIGQEDTLTLMKTWGGTYVDIPENPDKAHQLQAVLPYSSVVKLCAHFHGERLKYVPMILPDISTRDAEISQLHGTIPLRTLALRYQLSMGSIYNAIKRHHKRQQQAQTPIKTHSTTP